jgi:Mn2+/Fe2+ NRAMP family transporter
MLLIISIVGATVAPWQLSYLIVAGALLLTRIVTLAAWRPGMSQGKRS